jgi:hypothetical protein
MTSANSIAVSDGDRGDVRPSWVKVTGFGS